MAVEQTRYQPGDSPALRTALAMLRAGLRPIPTHPGQKRPIGEGWGLVRHTEDSLREIFRRNPGAGVGILLGDDGSGGGVIDIDVDNESLAEEVIDRMFPGGKPDTLRFRSNLGMHYLFRYDARLAKYGQTIIKGWEEDGLVRGNGNYLGVELRIGTIDPAQPVQEQTVLPPTLKADGSCRQWIGPGGSFLVPDAAFDDPGHILPIPESVFADLDEHALDQSEPEEEPEAEPASTRPRSASTTTARDPGPQWDVDQVKAAILPHALSLVKGWGLEITGKKAGSNGFWTCRAFDREDKHPSAGFSERTGVYTDRKGGPGLTIFQLAVAMGAYQSENAAINELGRSFNVPPDPAFGRKDGGGPPAPNPQALEDACLVLSSLSGVKPRPVEWLCEGMIPLGKLIILAGEGGLGKSTITLEAAARLSRGDPLFGCPLAFAGPSSIILIACEDDVADTTVPRLLAAGADLSRLHQVEGIRGRDGKLVPFNLLHFLLLERALESMPECRLVIIDPVGAFVGRSGVNDHRNSELSALLGPLSELAARRRVTILLVAHLNKGVTAKAVHRVMGGVAYVNSSRAAFIVARDQDDPERRVFAPLKFNLGPEPKSLAYRLRCLDPGEMDTTLSRPEFDDLPPKDRLAMGRQLARVEWLGEVDLTADEAFAQPPAKEREHPELQRAVELLRQVVGAGPIRAPDVYRAAEAAEVAEKTLKRAKAKEGIESYKAEEGWYWRYPQGDQDAEGNDPVGPHDPVGPVGPLEGGQEGQESQPGQPGHVGQQGQQGQQDSGESPSGVLLTWLVSLLSFGPRSAAMVFESARREGISEGALDAAANLLEIERFEEGGEEHWRLSTKMTVH